MFELVERNKSKNRAIAFTMSTTGALCGYYVSIMNSMANPILVGVFNLNEENRLAELGNVNFFFSIGAMVSVLLAGFLVGHFGRRKLGLILDILNIAFISLMQVQNLYVFQATRFGIGFTSCLMNIVAGITLVEVFPKKLSGIGNTLIYSFVTITILITFIQQAVISYDDLVANWRLILLYPIVIPIIRLIVLFFLFNFDSPCDVLKIHYQNPDIKDLLKKELSFVYEEEGLEEKVEEILAERQRAGQTKEPGIVDMFRPQYRKFMVSGLLINVGQQISGINFLIFFSTELFNKISGNGKTISIGLGIGNFLGSFICLYFVNRYSRIFTMKLGVITQAACLFATYGLIRIQNYQFLFFFVLTYIVFFAIGLGATMGLYINEILPPSGVGVCLALNWLVASMVGKLSPFGVEHLGSNNMILLFGCLCVLVYGVIRFVCVDKDQLNKSSDLPTYSSSFKVQESEVKEKHAKLMSDEK